MLFAIGRADFNTIVVSLCESLDAALNDDGYVVLPSYLYQAFVQMMTMYQPLRIVEHAFGTRNLVVTDGSAVVASKVHLLEADQV
jgi:hypothetical protein